MDLFEVAEKEFIQGDINEYSSYLHDDGFYYLPREFESEPQKVPRILCRVNQGKDLLVSVSAKQCRNMDYYGFVIDKNSESPFIKTVVEYLERNHSGYIESTLRQFYREFQPKNVEDVLRIGTLSNKYYGHNSPLGTMLPWINHDIEDRIKLVNYTEWKESKKYGFNALTTGDCKFFGPVSDEKGRREYYRLTNLTDSLVSNGMKVNNDNGNIWAYLLLWGHQYRFIVCDGHHRTAALAALGYENVVLQLKSDRMVINRSDWDKWAGVKKGLYSKKEALLLFDRLFYGA